MFEVILIFFITLTIIYILVIGSGIITTLKKRQKEKDLYSATLPRTDNEDKRFCKIKSEKTRKLNCFKVK